MSRNGAWKQAQWDDERERQQAHSGVASLVNLASLAAPKSLLSTPHNM